MSVKKAASATDTPAWMAKAGPTRSGTSRGLVTTSTDQAWIASGRLSTRIGHIGQK